jgi:hypothetical protein
MNVTGGTEAHMNVPHTAMANQLGLPPYMLRKIMLSNEKVEDAEFKCMPQARKRKNMKLGTLNNELETTL